MTDNVDGTPVTNGFKSDTPNKFDYAPGPDVLLESLLIAILGDVQYVKQLGLTNAALKAMTLVNGDSCQRIQSLLSYNSEQVDRRRTAEAEVIRLRNILDKLAVPATKSILL